MAVSMSPKQKVYQAVLNEIRAFIEHNNLKPGDKLPSERDLAESLDAGRSSIREALRAMELLGLIETRNGQGTFLSEYKPYQTVDLLASFILQGKRTEKDLSQAMIVIEKEIAKLAFHQLTKQDVMDLEVIVEEKKQDTHAAFFQLLCGKTNNLLLAKIWHLMEDFSRTLNQSKYDMIFYRDLLSIYNESRYASIEGLFVDRNIKE